MPDKREPFKPMNDTALDTSTYSLGDLVKITRLPIGTVRMWLERKILELGPYDKDASGKGSTRQFTLRTVYLAATMAEIARLGVSPSIAARWAEWIWRDTLSGDLVPHGDMVFIGNPTNRTAHICRRSEVSAEAVFPKTSWPGEDIDLSAVIVDVSSIAQKCRSLLGLPEGKNLRDGRA
jgi:hypothetical protein